MNNTTIRFTEEELAILMSAVQQFKGTRMAVSENLDSLQKKLVNSFMAMGE